MHLTIEPVAADRGGSEHLDACWAAFPLPVHDRWVCGNWEDKPGGSVVMVSGFMARIGGGPFYSLAEATATAVYFLGQHAESLASFSRHPSVCKVRLRLPVALPAEEARRLCLPRRLEVLGEQAGLIVEVFSTGGGRA